MITKTALILGFLLPIGFFSTSIQAGYFLHGYSYGSPYSYPGYSYPPFGQYYPPPGLGYPPPYYYPPATGYYAPYPPAYFYSRSRLRSYYEEPRYQVYSIPGLRRQ